MSSRLSLRSTIGRQSLVGADGMGEITQYRWWLDTALRDFANDILRSRLVTPSGRFDAQEVLNAPAGPGAAGDVATRFATVTAPEA